MRKTMIRLYLSLMGLAITLASASLVWFCWWGWLDDM